MSEERYLVYRSRKASDNLCVVAARNEKHALKVARQYFRLEHDAYASWEHPIQKQQFAEYCENWWKPCEQ